MPAGTVWRLNDAKTTITYDLLPIVGLGDRMEAGDEAYAILLARINFSATALLQGAQRPTTPMDKPVRKRRPTSQRALFLAPNERSPIMSHHIELIVDRMR